MYGPQWVCTPVWVPQGAPGAKISPAAASPSPLVLGFDLRDSLAVKTVIKHEI